LRQLILNDRPLEPLVCRQALTKGTAYHHFAAAMALFATRAKERFDWAPRRVARGVR
jgi:hypothetical protein